MSDGMKEQLKHQLALVTSDKKFKDQAFARVCRVLKSFLPAASCHAIAEDAIGDVTLRFMERIASSDEQQLTSFDSIDGLRAYLLRGVHNYALDRYRRWRSTVNQTTGGDDSRSEELHQEAGGARSRHETDDLIALIDSFSSSDDTVVFQVDLEGLDGLLENHGINLDESKIIKARLAGYSYQELATEQGGSADKYRKIVKRALERSGLDLDL